ncbi:hypothetical protein M413DRAFT_187073 [Hebeloma cylindrosporum]|uniref:Uncharacterized protein n=1 Tax=Hebeloma cylindrosporum TaxID=76867 RepID=A0A0C2YFQ3_HEBCY|nr:hypothetical protein M413DRAFT_187073 [Hebeloma cylindrosporum h7]
MLIYQHPRGAPNKTRHLIVLFVIQFALACPKPKLIRNMVPYYQLPIANRDPGSLFSVNRILCNIPMDEL